MEQGRAEVRYIHEYDPRLSKYPKVYGEDKNYKDYDFSITARDVKERTIRFFKQQAAERGLDWKEQYRAYCARERAKGRRP